MRKIAKILLLPFDLVLAVIVGLVGSLVALIARTRKEKNKRAIFIVPGADIQSIHRKYGTLNVYLQDDPDYFDEVYRFLWGRSNCRIDLRDNFHVIERRIGFPISFYGIASLFFLMSQAVFREKISLIHARDPYYCGFIAWVLSVLSNCPFCVSIHSGYDKRYELDGKRGAPVILGSRTFAKKLERFVFKKAHLIMPIRKHLGEEAILNGADPKKIRIIPHGVDLDIFNEELSGIKSTMLKETLGVNGEKKVLSFVGRLSKENYVYDILKLAESLGHKREDFVVLMAGGGNEENRLRKLVRENLFLSKTIILSGFLSHEEAIALRKISDVNLVLMGGFSLIEACASGKPVVAYDVEWHNELIKSGETGFLVKEHDINALTKAVSYLLDHPEEGNRLGEAAKKLIFKRHGLEATSAIKRACYEELLNLEKTK